MPLINDFSFESLIAGGLGALLAGAITYFSTPGTDSTYRLQRVRDYITNRDEQLVADYVNL